MQMSSPVPWSDLSAGQIERLVAAWLVRVHPGAQRVDGSGGDDGVDVRLRTADGLHVFEIKSFHGRLTPAQKRQIAKSLTTALTAQPDMARWTLVLPLDLSPAEITWFEQTLSHGVAIGTEWIGRTALESGLSVHTDLLRSMVPGSVERRALDYLAQYQQEIAGLGGGLADGAQRLQQLRNLLDTTDVDWAFDIGEVTPGKTTFNLRPKDPGSPLTKPVGGQFLLRVDPESDLAREIEDFMLYGRPVTIPPEAFAAASLDLPAGLGNSLGPDTRITASITYPDSVWHLRGRLAAVRAGRTIGTLAIDWNESTTGPAGGHYLAGRDSSGYLEVVLHAEPNSRGAFTINAPASHDVLPSEALSALRFLHRLRDADGIELHSADQPKIETKINGSELVTPDMGKLIAVAEALARVQEVSGVSFALPRSWTQRDAETLYFCDQLLANGSVVWQPPPGVSAPVPAAAIAGIAASGPLPRLHLNGRSAGLAEVELMGHIVKLPGEVHMDLADMVVVNLAELVETAKVCPAWETLRVELVSDQNTTARFYLADDDRMPADGQAGAQ